MPVLPPATDQWIRLYEPAPSARVRLVCLAHAGGAASYFVPVATGLAPDIEVLAVQYPGRQERLREPLLASVEELADGIAGALAAAGAADGRQLALFGHSLGASVAYEVARRLEAAGSAPAALLVSGRRAPTTPRDEQSYLLDRREFIDMIKALGGTDPRVFEDEDLLDMVLPALRTDYQAADMYRWTPGPPLSCPLHVLVGAEDERVTAAEARAWADLTTGSFTFHRFPGGHFYFVEQLPEVLNTIRWALRST